MSDETRDELVSLLESWGRALVSNDAKEIGGFASDDWVLVGETGAFEKSQFLAAVEAGDLTHDTFGADVSRVRTYGDTAVVLAHVTNTGRFKGEAFTSDEWSTDVSSGKMVAGCVCSRS